MSLGLGGGYQQSNSNSQSSSDQNTNQNGSYTNGPLNADQIIGALGASQSMFGGLGEAGTNIAGAGLANVRAGANTGRQAYDSALPQLQKTLGGSYLSAGNPAFQQMADRVGAATRSTIDSGFEGAGRYGSPLAARAQAMGVGDAIGALGYQNYAAERSNQMSALGSLPGFAAGAVAPGTAQLAAGYTPLQQYIAALGSVSPGTTGSTDLTKRVATNTTGSTDTSGFNIGAQAGSGGSFGSKVG